MPVIAEISDKMPTLWQLTASATLIAGICAAIALAHRALAWFLLASSILLGGLLTYSAADDVFVSGPLREAIWEELGWQWVTIHVLGPLLPAVAVAIVIVARRRRFIELRQLIRVGTSQLDQGLGAEWDPEELKQRVRNSL